MSQFYPNTLPGFASPYNSGSVIFPDLELVTIGIKDFTAPSLEQVKIFLQIMEQGKQNRKAVAIHCAHGKGRTGTIAACYLVKTYGLTSQQALDKVRQLRPGSVETVTQEQLVAEFETWYKDKLL
ncbi:hypothetical protein LOTGIDRAFT_157810 [Lottia gigantea]|uniref:Uncharacterized protein n=1 Tax=Lottia gigantea TaxID=225164 RepID=V4B2F7_LOTGI|nr:hypothetical protein LOTGIDRAFT_157810 [Lottia gigantea]ESP00537.1 hypothetical protein LOTGIDRAFT_157810 [Lottia gigantea]